MKPQAYAHKRLSSYMIHRMQGGALRDKFPAEVRRVLSLYWGAMFASNLALTTKEPIGLISIPHQKAQVEL